MTDKPDHRLLDADGSGKVLPQSIPDQLIKDIFTPEVKALLDRMAPTDGPVESIPDQIKETLTAEQLAKRVVCEIWETYCPMQTRTAEAIQRLISEAINQHTTTLQAQLEASERRNKQQNINFNQELSDKDKAIDRLKAEVEELNKWEDHDIAKLEQSETKVAGLVEALVGLTAEIKDLMVISSYPVPESYIAYVKATEALTDAQPLVSDYRKRIIQEVEQCLFGDAILFNSIGDYVQQLKIRLETLKNKQGGV